MNREQLREEARSSARSELVSTIDLKTSYGWLVLIANDEYEYGATSPSQADYARTAWYDGQGGLWLHVGFDIMPVLLTTKVLPVGIRPMDRPGTEVAYEGPVTIGAVWGRALGAFGGDLMALDARAGWLPVPAGEWQVRIQVKGREESQPLGDAYLDTIPDDMNDPWPERPDPVEHWWVTYYRDTYPHSGTTVPDDNDLDAMIDEQRITPDPPPPPEPTPGPHVIGIFLPGPREGGDELADKDAPVSLTLTRGDCRVLMSVRDTIPEGERRDRYLAILAKVAEPLGWEAPGPDD